MVKSWLLPEIHHNFTRTLPGITRNLPELHQEFTRKSTRKFTRKFTRNSPGIHQRHQDGWSGACALGQERARAVVNRGSQGVAERAQAPRSRSGGAHRGHRNRIRHQMKEGRHNHKLIRWLAFASHARFLFTINHMKFLNLQNQR